KPCWPQITMPIIWASWFCCVGCLARGRGSDLPRYAIAFVEGRHFPLPSSENGADAPLQSSVKSAQFKYGVHDTFFHRIGGALHVVDGLVNICSDFVVLALEFVKLRVISLLGFTIGSLACI